MPAGQIIGRTNEVRQVAQVMAELIAEYEETVTRLEKIRG
jgi:NAD(P)H-dependent flavin oxidoreductase YrpB (nitropropane dioxygenase family)